jgi:hypothetical protein
MLSVNYNPAVAGVAAPARRASSVMLSPSGKGASGGSGSSGGQAGTAVAAALAHPFGFAFVFGGELLALALLSASRRMNAPRAITAHARLAYAVVVCMLAVTAMAGCSGNGGGSPTSTTITVNATSGSTVVSTPITVDISSK